MWWSVRFSFLFAALVAWGTLSCAEITFDPAELAGTDVLDQCLDDPDKIEPGVCGCGVADQDLDTDGLIDCNDDCLDNDADGTCNEDDDCPDDAEKTEPGICGCGNSDDDADSDGVVACLESCPDDPSKLEPGLCGCGESEDDWDSDSAPDCIDPCPYHFPDDPDSDSACGLPNDCTGPNVVRDDTTGLCWQDPEGPKIDHGAATSYCDDLDIDGFDDWRVPTISELRTIVTNCPITEPGSACGITDSCLNYTSCSPGCDYCQPSGPFYLDAALSAINRSHNLWSSSVEPLSTEVYGLEFFTAFIRSATIDKEKEVRCVRDSGLPCPDLDTDSTCDYAQ